ncbi:lipopolysaccharide biosynthesis protein RfbH [Agarilytica rhodophyticola]|uniref:lipopolysaccharide biosynthesis protein RfbH n=1 Tax=Agarilytica rhodophyticola TaxID=1737490 RepID=UPI000B348E68|nr:lipopolysaccharide biosynthesis protein RfbH [Agarilytica rhodophyticola]
MSQQDIREKIAALVAEYSEVADAPKMFISGESPVPPSGKVIGAKERQLMVEASLDAWLTTGRFNDAFQKRLGEFLGVKHVLTTVSGSAANLLAMTALTSPKLEDRQLKPGDEVITVAAGFPTTVNPAIQNGLIPVFVDIDIPTYNIDPKLIEAAISEKTKAIMIAHTLGNPFDLKEVKRIAEQYNLWLIEDCCDALGTTYDGKMVGTFGDIATVSFYPAHHITMGEGGAVFTQSKELNTIIESFRDWGRDCYCEPGCDDTCGKRFDQKLGTLPYGYDHKYTYSHIGYNLKITDMQAACGLAQLDRLDWLVQKRKDNFNYLKSALNSCTEFIVLPESTPNSDPSWFGFPITLKETAGVSRVELLKFMSEAKIGTRLLFAGNLTRQPYFEHVKYRVSENLINTDRVMNQTFWIGNFPGLNEQHLDFVVAKFEEFFGISF